MGQPRPLLRLRWGQKPPRRCRLRLRKGRRLAQIGTESAQDTARMFLDATELCQQGRQFLALEHPAGRFDRLRVGCAIEDWTYQFSYGPGRASSKTTVNWVGSGLVTTPAHITVPALAAEKNMLAASMSLSVNGVDYVSISQRPARCSATRRRRPRLRRLVYERPTR